MAEVSVADRDGVRVDEKDPERRKLVVGFGVCVMVLLCCSAGKGMMLSTRGPGPRRNLAGTLATSVENRPSFPMNFLNAICLTELVASSLRNFSYAIKAAGVI